MTRDCPGADEWARFVDGEVTANRGAEIERHADGCARCRTELDDLRALTADIGASVEAPDPDAVARVMRAVEQGPASSSRPAARRRAVAVAAAGAFGLAAAAAVIFLLARAPESEEFRARGGPTIPSIRRNVGISLYADGSRLQQDTVVTPATAYQVGYSNLFADPADRVYLLLFAVDSAREVHWLFPGFTDPASDPEAVLLGPAARERPLPEEVTLDAPAAGRLRIVAMLAAAPLAVSAIESLAPPQLAAAALKAAWPEVEVRELTVDVQQ